MSFTAHPTIKNGASSPVPRIRAQNKRTQDPSPVTSRPQPAPNSKARLECSSPRLPAPAKARARACTWRSLSDFQEILYLSAHQQVGRALMKRWLATWAFIFQGETSKKGSGCTLKLKYPHTARSARPFSRSADIGRLLITPLVFISQVRGLSSANMEQAPNRGHEASPQSGLGVGCKLCPSIFFKDPIPPNEWGRRNSVRAQARRAR